MKPQKTKIYATLSCPYCKMESIWLKENNVQHDLVFVDLNHDEARIMVEKTGQMGVPVTEVIYDGNKSEFIIGFDKPRLKEIYNI